MSKRAVGVGGAGTTRESGLSGLSTEATESPSPDLLPHLVLLYLFSPVKGGWVASACEQGALMPSQVPASTASPTRTLSLPAAPSALARPREGCRADVPIRGPATQPYSAAQRETQIKCQLIVSAEEVLI